MSDVLTNPTTLARLNVEHFSRLLQTPLDEQKRTVVERLLAQEKAKLDAIGRTARAGATIRAASPGGQLDHP